MRNVLITLVIVVAIIVIVALIWRRKTFAVRVGAAYIHNVSTIWEYQKGDNELLEMKLSDRIKYFLLMENTIMELENQYALIAGSEQDFRSDDWDEVQKAHKKFESVVQKNNYNKWITGMNQIEG